MPKISHVKLLKKIKIPTASWRNLDSRSRPLRQQGTSPPRSCTVNGKDEVHPEGSYYLEWWEGGKRYREAAGPKCFRRRRQRAGKAGRTGRGAQRNYPGCRLSSKQLRIA